MQKRRESKLISSNFNFIFYIHATTKNRYHSNFNWYHTQIFWKFHSTCRLTGFFWLSKKLFGAWQFGKIDVLFNFIIQKSASLKSNQFSQFFCWEVNLRGLRAFILQKVHASVVERQKKKFCYPSLIWERRNCYNTFVSLR